MVNEASFVERKFLWHSPSVWTWCEGEREMTELSRQSEKGKKKKKKKKNEGRNAAGQDKWCLMLFPGRYTSEFLLPTSVSISRLRSAVLHSRVDHTRHPAMFLI